MVRSQVVKNGESNLEGQISFEERSTDNFSVVILSNRQEDSPTLRTGFPHSEHLL